MAILFLADKVFGPAILTETVYEGVKNVALSALMGINGNSYPTIIDVLHIKNLIADLIITFCF